MAGIEELDLTTGFDSADEGELRIQLPCKDSPDTVCNRIRTHIRYELCNADAYPNHGLLIALTDVSPNLDLCSPQGRGLGSGSKCP